MKPEFFMIDEILGEDSPEDWGIPSVLHGSKSAAHLCGHGVSVWAAEPGRSYWRDEAREVARKVASRVSGVAYDTHGNVGVVAPSTGAARSAFAVMMAAEAIYSGSEWPGRELRMLGVTDWPRHPITIMELCPHQLHNLINHTPENKMGVCHDWCKGQVDITIHPTLNGKPVQDGGEDFIVRYPSEWGLPFIMAWKEGQIKFAHSQSEDEIPPFGIDF